MGLISLRARAGPLQGSHATHAMKTKSAAHLRVQFQLVRRQLLKANAADARGRACRWWVGGWDREPLSFAECMTAQPEGGPLRTAEMSDWRDIKQQSECCAAQAHERSPVKQARMTSAPRPRASKIWRVGQGCQGAAACENGWSAPACPHAARQQVPICSTKAGSTHTQRPQQYPRPHLGALVGGDGGDAHLGHHLEHAVRHGLGRGREGGTR